MLYVKTMVHNKKKGLQIFAGLSFYVLIIVKAICDLEPVYP